MSPEEQKQMEKQSAAWKKRDSIRVGDRFVWHFKDFPASDGTNSIYGTSGTLPKKYMPCSDQWKPGRAVLEVLKVYEGKNGFGPFVDYWLIPAEDRRYWTGNAEDCIIINGPDAFRMERQKAKTRYKDKDGHVICLGDILSVEEFPDKFVGGSLSYEGVVEERDGTVCVTYYDIGEEQPLPLSKFPKRGRLLLTEEERKEYWKTAMLGLEPPDRWWKRSLYAGVPDGIME